MQGTVHGLPHVPGTPPHTHKYMGSHMYQVHPHTHRLQHLPHVPGTPPHTHIHGLQHLPHVPGTPPRTPTDTTPTAVTRRRSKPSHSLRRKSVALVNTHECVTVLTLPAQEGMGRKKRENGKSRQWTERAMAARAGF